MKKIIIIVLAAVLITGSGVGGYFYWRSTRTDTAEPAAKKSAEKKSTSKSESEESPVDSAEKKAAKKSSDAVKSTLPDDANVKKIIDLPPFIINLADTEQARYLRMSVSLGIEAETSEKPDQLFITRIRNAMLSVLSEKKSEDVLTAEGKAKLRKELLSAAQAASEEPYVAAIYITDFIVQL